MHPPPRPARARTSHSGLGERARRSERGLWFGEGSEGRGRAPPGGEGGGTDDQVRRPAPLRDSSGHWRSQRRGRRRRRGGRGNFPLACARRAARVTWGGAWSEPATSCASAPRRCGDGSSGSHRGRLQFGRVCAAPRPGQPPPRRFGGRPESPKHFAPHFAAAAPDTASPDFTSPSQEGTRGGQALSVRGEPGGGGPAGPLPRAGRPNLPTGASASAPGPPPRLESGERSGRGPAAESGTRLDVVGCLARLHRGLPVARGGDFAPEVTSIVAAAGAGIRGVRGARGVAASDRAPSSPGLSGAWPRPRRRRERGERGGRTAPAREPPSRGPARRGRSGAGTGCSVGPRGARAGAGAARRAPSEGRPASVALALSPRGGGHRGQGRARSAAELRQLGARPAQRPRLGCCRFGARGG